MAATREPDPDQMPQACGTCGGWTFFVYQYELECTHCGTRYRDREPAS